MVRAVRWIGHGKASGISIDVRQFDTHEFRDGKVIRVTVGYRSKEESLEAVGLDPDSIALSKPEVSG
jgi:hypothetical protein